MSYRPPHISLIAQLRGLTLIFVLAMLTVAWCLLWWGYQQRLADRQTAMRQAVDVAHASVRWAYAHQHIGKIDPALAQKQALAALDAARKGGLQSAAQASDDLLAALLAPAVLSVGAVVAVSILLWLGLERVVRDLGAGKNAVVGKAGRSAALASSPGLRVAMQPVADGGACPLPASAVAGPVSRMQQEFLVSGFGQANEAVEPVSQVVQHLRAAGAI